MELRKYPISRIGRPATVELQAQGKPLWPGRPLVPPEQVQSLIGGYQLGEWLTAGALGETERAGTEV